jgi:hypothetical protein
MIVGRRLDDRTESSLTSSVKRRERMQLPDKGLGRESQAGCSQPYIIDLHYRVI